MTSYANDNGFSLIDYEELPHDILKAVIVWEPILCAKQSSWYAISHTALEQSVLMQVFSTN